MKKRNFIRSLLVGVLLSATSSTFAATLFMRADGIEGSSLDADHRGWSDIQSVTGNFSEGYCGDFVVEKQGDKASGLILQKVFNGEVIPAIDIESTANIEGARAIILKIRVSQATIGSVEASGDDGEQPNETLIINGEMVKMIHFHYDHAGQPAGMTETDLTCPRKSNK